MKKLWNTMNLSKSYMVESETLFTIFNLSTEQTSKEFQVTKGLINLGNKIEILREKVNHLNNKIRNDS